MKHARAADPSHAVLAVSIISLGCADLLAVVCHRLATVQLRTSKRACVVGWGYTVLSWIVWSCARSSRATQSLLFFSSLGCVCCVPAVDRTCVAALLLKLMRDVSNAKCNQGHASRGQQCRALGTAMICRACVLHVRSANDEVNATRSNAVFACAGSAPFTWPHPKTTNHTVAWLHLQSRIACP